MIDLISGPKLKLLLKRKGISQTDISGEFNIAPNQVSRYFTGRNEMPARFIVKVAAYAGLTLKDITEGHIDTPIKEIPDNSAAPELTISNTAAEPTPTYEPKKIKDQSMAPKPATSTLISIDVTGLDIIIHELRTKLTIMEHELSKIKQELELVNH